MNVSESQPLFIYFFYMIKMAFVTDHRGIKGVYYQYKYLGLTFRVPNNQVPCYHLEVFFFFLLGLEYRALCILCKCSALGHIPRPSL